MDESGSKGAQNELYSSVWAPQLDYDHFWKNMVLIRFSAICGPKLAHFKRPFGLERGQNCSTWAQNGLIPLFCAPQMFQQYLELEKHIFDPFLTDFWSQNSPFSRHFVTLEWPKWLAMGSKRADFTCLCTPNGLGSFLEKHIFDLFLTHFWAQNNPFSRHFVTLEGPKWLTMGSKWAQFTCLGTPNGLGSFLEKHIFAPFLTHFHPKRPIFKAFGGF